MNMNGILTDFYKYQEAVSQADKIQKNMFEVYTWYLIDEFIHNFLKICWCLLIKCLINLNQGSPNQAKWATSSPWFQ